MIRIGYTPGAFDLFHIGHLNLLRRGNELCDDLIAGVVADDVLVR
jgi:glycerol-3-phosphate cytidylyltransferase